MRRPSEELSKASERARTLIAAALLRSEADGLRLVKRVIQEQTERFAGRLAALQTNEPSRLRAELLKSSKELEKELTGALLAARDVATQASDKVTRQHMTRIAGELDAHWVPYTPGAFELPPTVARDNFSTLLASGSLANAWLKLADVRLRQGTPVNRLAQDTARALNPSVDRTVVTENSRVFNDTLQESAKYVTARLEPYSPARQLLFKRWDALLDRRTCATCSNLDNEVVPASAATFRGGLVPGYVHPRCRCISIPCLHQYDLDVAKVVSRDVFGPGVGRAAVGDTRRHNWEDSGLLPGHRIADSSQLSEVQLKAWTRKYNKALHDEEFRRTLVREEVRRHETTQQLGIELPSPKARRIAGENNMARDRSSPREVFERHLGREIGKPSGHILRGKIVSGPR